MDPFSGIWEGQIRGTNHGSVRLEIALERQRVTGTGHVREHGQPELLFDIDGMAEGDTLEFELRAHPRPGIMVGNGRGSATLIQEDRIEGNWVTLTGTNGQFEARRTSKPKSLRKTQANNSGRRRKRPGVLSEGLRLDAYELVRRLGGGASSEVWLARAIETREGVPLEVGDEVALKVYTGFLTHPTQSIRIQREFLIASRFDHDHLATVFDLCISPSRTHGTFMAMEYIAGETLKDLIARRGALKRRLARRIGMQLFRALVEVHSHNAIHRDVKAANIMVQGEADELDIKLVDLGIVFIESDHQLTAHSMFLGSKHSSSPEQLRGDPLDVRADVYGAGSVLFHCLKGRPMYDGAGTEAAIGMRMLTAPEQLDNPSNDRLIAFVNRCIAVNKEDRPSSADECVRLLQQAGGDVPQLDNRSRFG